MSIRKIKGRKMICLKCGIRFAHGRWDMKSGAESAVGFGANIPMNSPAGIQNKEGMEEEENR